MAEQFRQPSIPRPDLSQHSSWASVSRTHCDWLRAVGPQLGMDVSKLILGDVLSSIIGDDANSFGMYFMADIAQDVKASILERMDWEVSVPETPGEVKQKLKQVINLIQPLNFNDEVNYKKAGKIGKK